MWSTDQSLCQPIPSVCGGDAGDAFASSLMMTDLCDTGSVNALDIGHDMTADDGIYNWSCTT